MVWSEKNGVSKCVEMARVQAVSASVKAEHYPNPRRDILEFEDMQARNVISSHVTPLASLRVQMENTSGSMWQKYVKDLSYSPTDIAAMPRGYPGSLSSLAKREWLHTRPVETNREHWESTDRIC